MTAQAMTAEPTPPEDPAVSTETEAARMNATFALVTSGGEHPELRRAAATARLDLAAAILAMDAAEGIHGRHNLHEQMAVEAALRAYGQALADQLRGEKS